MWFDVTSENQITTDLMFVDQWLTIWIIYTTIIPDEYNMASTHTKKNPISK